MAHLGKRLTLRAALAFALCVALSPAPAYAAPSAAATQTTTSVEAKRAEAAAAVKELEAMRVDLANQVESYVDLGRRIEQTEAEISQVSTQIAQMDVQLEAAELAYEERVQELYRGDRRGMLETLLTAESLQDLFARLHYLSRLTEHDVGLMKQLRMARLESMYLQGSLEQRIAQLQQLQTEADLQRARIEEQLATQESRIQQIGGDLARLLWSQGGRDPGGAFVPDLVISDANMRASGSMTASDIQAFLDAQPGTLKNYRTKDHAGRTRTAAEMIAEASVAWGVSPKVILVTLQKEQSLLTRQNPKQSTYDWAMGCGRADSRTFYQYQGFGKQIWFGAQKLRQNGDPWKPGITMRIDGSKIHPQNASTYSLYKYTPHFRGTMSFWMLYWRYFGDPLL